MIKETQIIMGMPATLICPDISDSCSLMRKIFDFFRYIDDTYSTFKPDSLVSKLNGGELLQGYDLQEFNQIITLADRTKTETDGYFDVWHDGVFDPSGIVKGWAIEKAATMMAHHTESFYVEAGGDIQVAGKNEEDTPWKIGIRNPFKRHENVSVISLTDASVATSGSAIRGQHIYDPVNRQNLTDVVSLSVIAPRIIDADRMATAAFAMGVHGIQFIESLDGYEGYLITKDKKATMTHGWKEYEIAQ